MCEKILRSRRPMVVTVRIVLALEMLNMALVILEMLRELVGRKNSELGSLVVLVRIRWLQSIDKCEIYYREDSGR